MENKVTIVIPTFNRANYVCDAIDCALAQTVPCHIIVCDHGSSDNTPEVIKKYGDKITYIRREKDFGPHFCWLEGILNAKTEFIKLLFDDDLIKPEFVEETLKLMNDDVGLVFTDADVLNTDTNTLEIPQCFNLKKKYQESKIIKSEEVEKCCLTGMMISPAACLYRKDIMLDSIVVNNLPFNFGGAYHGVGSDLLMNLLACSRYKYVGINVEPLTIFGSHEGSITMDARKDEEKRNKFNQGYNAYRKYYALCKLYEQDSNIRKKTINLINKNLKLNKRIIRNFKLFLKAIGLRKKEVI